MKKLLILIIGLIITFSVFAECAANGLSVFPNGHTIKQNSIFVLDGYMNSQKVILGLNKEYDIYLKSGDKKIKLLVYEICVGQFRLTQAILRPERELEVGLEYTMYIDNLPQYESLHRYNLGKPEPITYTVMPVRDIEKPQLKAKPKEIDKTLSYLGCGPSIYVSFDNPIKDSSEIIVKTTVKNLKTKKETTYYIQPYQDKISVGHSMCSGAFDFDDSEYYEIEFSFMDSSGNLTNWSGKRIKFSKPTKPNNLK